MPSGVIQFCIQLKYDKTEVEYSLRLSSHYTE